MHLVHLVPHKIWFQNVRAFKCPARIHPRLDTLANCHRQHLASGALPQLEHLSVAALVMDSIERPGPSFDQGDHATQKDSTWAFL